eukprot:TRINITY_DN5959_c0_g1_i1.p1 TRINITY_DN5959_c0_g1~~TRINITY_DN5959_c0_g1_i1.p1  ORF type:complete len:693 (+),score=171.73 TRINITY_DN5959_c0_g1_i1:100-2079(+)
MSPSERLIACGVEHILPRIKANSAKADRTGAFPAKNIRLLREIGMLGLLVPREYGGLGGGLRDLTGVCFALASVCPSTALSFYFHCSASARGILALKAIEENFGTESEREHIQQFSERLLLAAGQEGLFLSNYTDEKIKTSVSSMTIDTEAQEAHGGYYLTGEKVNGCAADACDMIVVTAKLAGTLSEGGLCIFLVDPNAEGVSWKDDYDTIGLRSASAKTVVLNRVFVSSSHSLVVPGLVPRMIALARGSFFGNQPGVAAVACGCAYGVYKSAMKFLTEKKFEDNGKMIGESPFHQLLIGKMCTDLETATLFLRRQVELETCFPPILSKEAVVRQWRMCKSKVAELSYEICMSALKAGGTTNTEFSGPISRGLRDMCMGLVSGFPPEFGYLEVAKSVTKKAPPTAVVMPGKLERSATMALHPYQFIEYALKEKHHLSSNVRMLRFSLPNPHESLGLPIGQHLSVKANINGVEVVQYYAPISTYADIGYFDLVVKLYAGGVMSGFFENLKVGEFVGFKGPEGNFRYHANMAKKIGLITGGAGITPMLRIIQTVVNDDDDDTQMTLLYSNLTEDDILLKDRLDSLAEQHLEKFSVQYTVEKPGPEWRGHTGYIDKSQIRTFCPPPAHDTRIMLCGPPPMKRAMTKHLTELGYTADMIVDF